jgi:hypothetical protein
MFRFLASKFQVQVISVNLTFKSLKMMQMQGGQGKFCEPYIGTVSKVLPQSQRSRCVIFKLLN